ncbi:hypothetical protein ACIGO6_39125 [Streptomyces sp. NPDC053750]|uniref:hypothetical protein n=1 Tax=Streptomyces sp. NPDC053750 TaxID=3365714 RepID=UPI0037D0B3E7
MVAAVGRPRLIRGEDIKPGAVVIDAGYSPSNVGDVDFDTALARPGLITPVPGTSSAVRRSRVSSQSDAQGPRDWDLHH